MWTFLIIAVKIKVTSSFELLMDCFFLYTYIYINDTEVVTLTRGPLSFHLFSVVSPMLKLYLCVMTL